MKILSAQSAPVLQRTEAHVRDSGVAEPQRGRNRLLLLVSEGGLSFRFHSFPDIMTAQSYIQDQGVLLQGRTWAAFCTHDSKPVDATGTPMPAEVVVILRDASQPDLVQLASFVDLQSALSYLRASVAKGLDLGSTLLYWVTPVPLTVPLPTATAATVQREAPRAPTPVDSSVRLHPPVANDVRPGTDTPRPTDRTQSDDKPVHIVPEKTDTRPSRLSRFFRQCRDWPGWDGFAPQIVGAALLKEETYENLSRDSHATGRAAIIVAAIALSAGIGSVGAGIAPALGHVIAALVGWIACATIVQFVGKAAFGGRNSSSRAVPESLGLASVPALLLFFGAVPVFGPLFVLAIFGWLLVTMTLAVEQSLELNRESAILTAAFGWLLFFAIAQVAPTFLF